MPTTDEIASKKGISSDVLFKGALFRDCRDKQSINTQVGF